MAYDVKVRIDLSKPIGNRGFGVPLILLEHAEKEVPYTKVSDIAGLESLGIDNKNIVHKAAKLMFAQAKAPETIAVRAVTTPATTALADASLVDKDWRHLIVVSGGAEASDVEEISELVEAMNQKLYFAGLDVDDTTAINIADLRHTVLFYCDATEDVPVPVAALVGETAGRTAGSFTYKNLILKGIAAQDLTDTQIEAIHQKGGITFVSKAGDNVTSEGKVAGGEYIDVIDSEDYVVMQLAYKTQKLMNSVAKIPYDNNGIALLESVAKDVLQGAFNNGMIATKADGSPDYWVNYALRENTQETDRAARKYLGGNFGFALAGAIHTVEISGSITV